VDASMQLAKRIILADNVFIFYIFGLKGDYSSNDKVGGYFGLKEEK